MVAPGQFARDRAQLEVLSRELGAMRYANDVLAALDTTAPGWSARFDAVVARIAPRERWTYFNEATLRGALTTR
ncbi:MAG: hypothetical protein QM759_02880 [Terricaulis sp.]